MYCHETKSCITFRLMHHASISASSLSLEYGKCIAYIILFASIVPGKIIHAAPLPYVFVCDFFKSIDKFSVCPGEFHRASTITSHTINSNILSIGSLLMNLHRHKMITCAEEMQKVMLCLAFTRNKHSKRFGMFSSEKMHLINIGWSVTKVRNSITVICTVRKANTKHFQRIDRKLMGEN